MYEEGERYATQATREGEKKEAQFFTPQDFFFFFVKVGRMYLRHEYPPPPPKRARHSLRYLKKKIIK